MRKLVLILLTVSHVGSGLAQQSGYRVGRLDVIRIDVPGEADFSRDSVVVSEKGTISLNIIGELNVEGLTVSQISELIRSSLVERKILVQPAVTVSVREYRSQSVTVLGEVKTTGRYYLKGGERLLDVIAEAGGLSPNAGDISITRTASKGTQILTVKSEGLLTDQTALVAGDILFVHPKPSWQIFVSGEVVSGKPLAFVDGMTVSQAIVMAGGLTRFGSKSKVTIRRSEGEEEKTIRVNLGDIEKGKTRDIVLKPNDLIIVGRRVF
jgi:polysaccharide export outer membrane protein